MGKKGECGEGRHLVLVEGACSEMLKAEKEVRHTNHSANPMVKKSTKILKKHGTNV